MKTKLGISAALFGAGIYFMALVGGYIPLLLLGGYALLFETDDWLKKSAVKAFAVSVFFSLLGVFVSFIPNLISVINEFFGIFRRSYSIPIVSNLVSIANTAINVFEKLFFLMFAFKALNHESAPFAPVDTLLAKHDLTDK